MSPWLTCLSAKAETDEPRIPLLCFAYAGGSASIYRFLGRILPVDLAQRVEIWAIEYPGHGRRLQHEAPLSQFADLVAAITNAIAGSLPGTRALLLGYSLGGWVAFEVARDLQQRGWNLEGLLIAACGAPHLAFPSFGQMGSSVEALAAVLRRYGTAEVDTEDIRARLPWYRAVFGVRETYRYRPGAPLSCPLVVFGGSDDREIPESALRAWQAHTRQRFTSYVVPAAHMFLRHPGFLHPLIQELTRWRATFENAERTTHVNAAFVGAGCTRR